MTRDIVKPLRNPGKFTAFVLERYIELLIRSVDFYQLSPLDRYLYNMFAVNISLEDARTEKRVYDFLLFDQLRVHLDLVKDNPNNAASLARDMCYFDEQEFGVVHLYTHGFRKGEIILGDSPDDFTELEDWTEEGRFKEWKDGLENNPNFTGEE